MDIQTDTQFGNPTKCCSMWDLKPQHLAQTTRPAMPKNVVLSFYSGLFPVSCKFNHYLPVEVWQSTVSLK